MRPLAVCLATILGGCADHSASPAPLSLITLDGKPVKLSTAAIQVVVFMRSDCPIANRAAPEIRELHERFQSKGVEFALVYVNPREPVQTIRRHLKEYQLSCPAYRDSTHAFAAKCGATVTPEAVVFLHGKIVYLGRINDQYSDVGQPRAAVTSHDLAEAIEAALAGGSIPHPRPPAVGCPIADLKP